MRAMFNPRTIKKQVKPSHIKKSSDSSLPKRVSNRIRAKAGSKDTIYIDNFIGDEYDPLNDFLIRAIGCSCSDGCWFSDYSSTWSDKFKKLYKSKHGTNVNMVNYAHAGAANDYMVRTILEYDVDIIPDLYIITMTQAMRKEIIGEDFVSVAADWVNSNLSNEYMKYHDDMVSHINMLQNIILLQNYFRSNKIKYIIAFAYVGCDEYWYVKDHYMNYPSDHPIKKLIQLVDETNIAKEALCGSNLVDYALDNYHPGDQTHTNFAQRLFDFYENNKDVL